MFDDILTDEMVGFTKARVKRYGRKLSPRRLEALRLYNRRYSRKRAAEIMDISENTFSHYIRCIRDEIGIRSPQELLALEMILAKENDA